VYCASHGVSGSICRIPGCVHVVEGNEQLCPEHIATNSDRNTLVDDENVDWVCGIDEEGII
jgi:hypothetical protein